MRTSGRLLWDSIQSLAIPEKKITALNGLSAVLILACAPFYDDRRFWLIGNEPVSDAEWDDISKALGQMELEVMSTMIGLIIPHVLGSLTGLDLLPCDGASYLRVDYPLLYDAIDTIYHVDADTFRVPDLRDKFPLSEGVDFALDDTGGEKEHQLEVSEMPGHSHDNLPHFHTDGAASPVVVTVGAGAPVPSAVPIAGVTSSETISIDNTGGDEPHNNMPPYLVVRFAIVAG